MDNLISQYIFKEFFGFSKSNKCCINLFGPFCRLEHILTHFMSMFNVKNKILVINGHHVNKIYKLTCNHCIHQQGIVQLTEESRKNILLLLGKWDTYQQILPRVFRMVREKPVLPPNRFTICPPRNTIFHTDVGNIAGTVQQTWRILPYRTKILEKVFNNRIVVINGDVSLEKDTGVPMFILEQSIEKGAYCKILCVQSDNLSAITNCSILAKHINERVGVRVGFQIYLQSRVSEASNLIYTTAVFCLRVLMGQNPSDSFRHVSHIIVSDVHLHHAYTDVLLNELRKILPYFPDIKIVLLSNTASIYESVGLISYFGEGEELKLNVHLNEVQLYYIEETKAIAKSDRSTPTQIVGDIFPSTSCNDNITNACADKALEKYAQTGSDSALNIFLYFVHGENVSIDYAHLQSGCTALIAAAKHNNSHHISRLLIFENANPFLQDRNKLTALEYAQNSGECIRILVNFMEGHAYALKPPAVDFDLINQLVQVLTTTWEFGHILICLPSFEDLLKIRYGILKMRIIGRIPQEITMFVLHEDMQCDELQPIIAESCNVKIILTTHLAESISYINDVSYVIDCGINCVAKYDPVSKSTAYTNEWASQASLETRSTIAGRFTAGHCFRLMARRLFGKLPLMSQPELIYAPLNQVLLSAKLLCPQEKIAEYFQHTIVNPPQLHVLHGIEFLKKLEIFDCLEEVTWLGCRLIDVPVDLELGKSLVLSILLRCLDPVLTVVSFFSCTMPTEIARCIHHKSFNNLSVDRLYSDHLILLRLYQAWEHAKSDNAIEEVFSDEHHYIINGILEKVSEIRTQLVGALRSTQLIHNQGPLSMHSINSKANNWAVIKAALAGGLYPKLCMIDRSDFMLKSKTRNLFIHPCSTLRDPRNTVFCPMYENYPTDWMVFVRETNSIVMNSISNCTLISPVTVALFAGKADLDLENIVFPTQSLATVHIDEWIWLQMDSTSALLLYKLRQKFHATYMDFLQSCGDNEKSRRTSIPGAGENQRILDVLCALLDDEDKSVGFEHPNRGVGKRPKAATNKFTSNFDIRVCPKPINVNRNLGPIQYHCLDKEFFLVNLLDSNEIMQELCAPKSTINIMRNPLFNPICASVSPQKLTFIIVCNLDQKLFTNVALVKSDETGYFLRNYFHISIPVCDLIIACTALHLTFPPLRSDWSLLKLDNEVGEAILNML